MRNIWMDLPRPVMCLAPMEGVTDTVFRQVIASIGKPDIFFTEFTSVDGMFSKGYEFVAQRLEYSQIEQPLIAQIWGLEPKNYRRAGEFLVKRGFAGVDINMGCPVRAVVSKGACSALVQNKPLAAELIQSLKRGVKGKIPVSVKIRIGFHRIETEAWVEYLLEQGIDALIVHGRTTKQMSKVPADWEEIAKAVRVRDAKGVGTKIIGNGDVTSLEEATRKVERYGVDGVMVGRGIFQDPYLFNPNESFEEKSIDEKLALLRQHVSMFRDLWGEERHFDILKKFFKVYVSGFRGAKRLRMKLMDASSYVEVERLVDAFE